MNLNQTKINIKIITLNTYDDHKNIHINNQVIQYNKKYDTVKYLDVRQGENLTSNIHINKNSPRAIQG